MQKTQTIFCKYFRRPLLIVAALLAMLVLAFGYMTSMPSQQAPDFLPTAQDNILAGSLEVHVRKLAGPRNEYHPEEYKAAGDYIAATLRSFKLQPTFQKFTSFAREEQNILVRISGIKKTKTIIVGAHYDSHGATPGADDNASGTAALLEIARLLSENPPENDVILAFYANEEPPHFQTETMGSVVHANSIKDVDLMISLEMLGFYSTEPNSQKYPAPLNFYYPDVADFVAVVGPLEDRGIVEDLTAHLRGADMKTFGFSTPKFMPAVGFSDHWSYWQRSIPAVMVTDTAFFRNPHYHRDTDTPETLDYPRMARITSAVASFL